MSRHSLVSPVALVSIAVTYGCGLMKRKSVATTLIVISAPGVKSASMEWCAQVMPMVAIKNIKRVDEVRCFIVTAPCLSSPIVDDDPARFHDDRDIEEVSDIG